MRTLTTMTNQRISTRIKTVLATLSCLALLLGSVAVAPIHANAQGSRYALTVRNRSAYTIYRLYVSSTDQDVWGPDQLGERVIVPGSDFVLTNIVPGEYDLKVVGQNGVESVRRRINVFADRSWTLY